LFQIVSSFLTFTFHISFYISTRLSCDGINDQFITQSLLSPSVKKIENQSTFAEVMGN